MARHQRSKSSTNIYHVFIRGIDRQKIFRQPEDYYRFLDFLLQVKKQCRFTLYAYCLMENHIHLLIKDDDEELSTIFRKLGTRYALWFNKKYDRVGHLFQNRFGSEPVEDDNYFITALIYIYQNPVKGGLCKLPVDYKWSSRCRLGKGDGLIDEKSLLEIISISDITRHESEMEIKRKMIDEKSSPRKRAHSDEEIFMMLKEKYGVKNSSEFHLLLRPEQQSAVDEMRERNIPLRRIVEITNLTRGQVEYWCRK